MRLVDLDAQREGMRMINREKVIKGLERFIADFKPFCGNKSDWQRVDDALALLKAQEPVEPKKVNRYIDFDGEGKPFTPETYDCGSCGKELPWKAKYCPECGRAVKAEWAAYNESLYITIDAQESPTSECISSATECLLHPQDADDSDMAKAIDVAVRAMRLLKVSEPQVMTLEEIPDAVFGWMEVSEQLIPCVLEDVYVDDTVGFASIEDGHDYMCASDYGKTWRVWTSKPTDEQREATPWR